jgi:predicted hydrolase (HD superfamily)
MKTKIKELLLSVKRKGMKELVDWLENESDYFTAPASTRFHEARKGGLANHCWNVYILLKEKNERFNLKIPEESVIIAGLLHDLCKVNVYKDKKLKNGALSSIPYELKEDLPLGHSTKSIFIINRFMELTKEEALMIRWHMSWSDYEFKKHIDAAKKINPAVMALITADIEASDFLDEGFEK